MADFKIGCSPLTSRIYAGNVLKNGTWAKGKKDVTDDAVRAVAQLLLQTDEQFHFNYNGKKYALRVVEISKE